MTTEPAKSAWSIVKLAETPELPCPCGSAQRAFLESGSPQSVHLTHITLDAKTHYHKVQTETYYILNCHPGACIELDGERIPIQQGDAIRIPPYVRHRAIGEMTILNMVVPPFDANDEYFD